MPSYNDAEDEIPLKPLLKSRLDEPVYTLGDEVEEEVDEEADEDEEDDLIRNGFDDDEKSTKRTQSELDEKEDSSIEMVRRIVPITDDPSLPCFTIRVFIIGTLLCLAGSATSQLFFFKSNSISFSSFFIILVSFPLGKLMHRWLPDRQMVLLGFRFSLNPGPFNRKEHLLISVLAGSGSNASYAGEIISVQSLYYKQELSALAGMTLLLSTQAIGFGLVGLTNRLLVRQTKMIWPSTLVFISLFETLHNTAMDPAARLFKQGRMRFFLIAFLAIFVWQMVPGVIFPTLTSFATLCVISNHSPIMSILGSGYDGFGMMNLSLDWSVIGATGPIFTPLFSQLCFFGGLMASMWLIVPALYFSNFWNSRSFDSPLGSSLYSSNFARFPVQEILTSDLSLNVTKFEEVGPLLLTPYFALSYGVSFAVLTSTLSTVALFYSKDIKAAIYGGSKPDIHVQILERNYDPIPLRFYAFVFFPNLFASCSLLYFNPSLQLPIWGLFLGIAVAAVALVPLGIIAAITNTTIGLNVLSEFIAGVVFPGPIANIVFKCYTYMSLVQAIDLTSDLKLGLYAKIPPKQMFIAQVYGTTLGAFVNYTLIRGIIEAKRDYLDGSVVDPTGQYSGRAPAIFFSASVIWGLITPSRFFVGPYRYLYWGFPIGLLLPLIPWILHKRYPRGHWKSVSVPLILHGAISPPQLPTNIIISGFVVAVVFQGYVARYRAAWFDKYGYVLSAALDAGTSINALVIYLFGLSHFVEWWGNSAIDSEHCKSGS